MDATNSRRESVAGVVCLVCAATVALFALIVCDIRSQLSSNTASTRTDTARVWLREGMAIYESQK